MSGMKAMLCTLALLISACEGVKVSMGRSGSDSEGGPVAEVVTMLKEMLSKSKADREEEAKLFGEFKAYCDDQNRGKTKSIEDLGNSITMLNSRIEELTATGKKLNKELKELDEDLAANADAQKEATQIRDKTAAEFAENKDEAETMIKSLEDAKEALGTVQDPNTLLVQLGISMERVKNSAFLEVPEKSESQSGAVFGVLTSVLDNTKTDLEKATMDEDKSIEAHEKLMSTLTSKEKAMSESETSKKAELADTETELSTRQGELESDTKTKADDEAFLANLIADCKEKTRINNERVALRRGEEEAVQTALEVLDSDRAAKTFKKVGSTSFVQTSSMVNRNDNAAAVMSQVFHLLRSKAHQLHSTRLAEVAGLTIPKNPFNRVLKAIVEMKAQIKEEEKVDKKQFDLCKKNRKEGAAEKAEKEEQINGLNMAMQSLETTMSEPENGLKDTIKRETEELEQNQKDQKEETTTRREENHEYQVNIKNLVIAQQMLSESVNVLKAYYDEMAAHPLNALLQVSLADEEEDDDAPEVKQGPYSGQGGQKVIDMIEGIIKETADEENMAHKAEGSAQRAFEDSMQLLTDQEKSLRKSIEENKVALATAEQDLIAKEKERDATEEELEKVEAFLHEIKPTCDFIEANYETRKASRVTEGEALDKATDLIKKSPAYVAAEEKANSQR
eukprot:TRINITY_DN4664_c5_g3_i1.p1 TRINITY_DN4664_c5_g3~~TRINITY_DN4664_c5_g3_i1.p1  ORF type:complete len:679 (-),score=223.47 TRINITY_DN4664_c5_g3_i1:265-2301(-)